MIARLWRGTTAAADADAYLDYLRETGLKFYRATPGNLGVFALRRMAEGRAELLLVSLWESEAAIESFAGADIERAVFYPEDERYLIDYDLEVSHYEVVDGDGVGRQSPTREGGATEAV